MRKKFVKLVSVLTHPRLAVVLHDLLAVAGAWGVAIVLRDRLLPEQTPIDYLSLQLLIVTVVQGAVFWWTGLYRGLWRFASLPDLANILRAVVTGALIVTVTLFFYHRAFGVPRTLLIIFPVVLMTFLGAPRLLFRYWKDNQLAFNENEDSQRVLIVGAGRAAETLIRDLASDGAYTPVGILDDDRRLRGARLRGIAVLGCIADLPDAVQAVRADVVIIAMPAATNAQMQRIVTLCEQTQASFRTLPRLQDMVEGRSGINEIKDVDIEDLLGREQVQLDWRSISEGLAGKRVLITGGGGSIGAELCRQIARVDPAALVVVDRGEYNLFTVERLLRRDYPDLALQAVLGDICDTAAMDCIMSRVRPDVVFHAAAYKQVPMLQGQLREEVRNNAQGTTIMARLADHYETGTFVLISTDKAVNPGSVMGATKRLAETLCQNFNAHSPTRFITVRFGNVLNSAGSVVPVFREQIQRGGPVTVTHPEVSRYFMTIPEASQLILQASVLGEGGEIYVLNMGEPVKIRYMAEQMIRLAGKIPDQDIDVVYTGLRPGEKLYEELFHDQERYQKTSHEKLLLARYRPVNWALFNQQLLNVDQACDHYDEERLLQLLNLLVPEHKPGTADNVIRIGSRSSA